MVSGQAGHHGEPVVSHAAVDPNSAVALAPIPLPRAVENRVPGMKQSHKSAIHKDANVSKQGNEGFSCSFRCLWLHLGWIYLQHYAYTRRIFNAYPVANKGVDKPQKTTRAIRILLLV